MSGLVTRSSAERGGAQIATVGSVLLEVCWWASQSQTQYSAFTVIKEEVMSDRYRDRFGDYDRFGRRIGHQQRRYPRSTGGDIDYERSCYGREGTDWGTGTETSRSFYDRDYSTRDRDSMRDRERSWRGADLGARAGDARRDGRGGETDIEKYDIDRGASGRYGREETESAD